jgi:hypothetical protein
MLKKNKLKLATAGAALTLPFFALPAAAATCVPGDESNITCTYGSVNYMGLSFTNISVTLTATGTGSVVLGSLSEVTPVPGEYGLELTYSANTGTNPNSQADVSLTYNVSGSLIDDAYAAFSGSTSFSGTENLSETLSNNVTISLLAAGSTTVTFSPVSTLGVIKDQNDFSGASSEGGASSSALENAFSLTTTPIPGTLPLMATGLVGLWGLRRKRKAKGPLATA